MKYLFPVLLLALTLIPIHSYGDSYQLGSKLVPSEIMEHSDGILQVFSTTSGGPVDKLVATSSDSLVVQVTGISKDPTGLFANVKIHATGAGTATISLAAPGFYSLQVPITVYKAHEDASQLLIKTTPNAFSTTGPSHGYVSVETVNAQGEPVKAISDTPVAITTSDDKIVKLVNNQLVIKQGSYFAVGEFNIDQPGSATITASSSLMQPTSSTVTVTSIDANTIQDYVYPQTINALSSAYTYLIVQLHDSSGNPVIAKEDIPVSIQIANSTSGLSSPLSELSTPYSWSSTLPNANGQTSLIQTNQQLVISKGSYWGYIPLEVNSGVKGKFLVSVSAKGYLSSLPFQFSTNATNAILDNKIARADILPILETGNKELIGVLHLQDIVPTPSIQSTQSTLSSTSTSTTSTTSTTTATTSQNPQSVIANDNLAFEMDSSNLRAVSVPNIVMEHGSQAALIFAQTGISADPVTLNLVTTIPQSITPTVTAVGTNVIKFVAEPLIPQALPATTFPLAIYMTNNEALDSFSNDFKVAISPEDSAKASSLSVSKNIPVFVTDVTLLKDGSQTINVIAPGYSTQFTVDSSTTKPKSVLLDHPDQLMSNSNYTFSMELLDGQQAPAVTDSDINLQLVSSDPTVIQVPDHLLITKGSYYGTFEAHAHGGGTAEITVLANEMPLTKFDMQVTTLTPTLAINGPDRADPNTTVTSTLLATNNQTAINNLAVDWKVTGGTVQKMDSITDKDGKAMITILATDPSAISITATASGGQYSTQTATKQIAINPPLQAAAPDSNQQSTPSGPLSGFSFTSLGPMIFVIPAAAVAVVIVLKKKGMLNGILGEGIMNKISGIKEKMMELRQN